MHSRQLAGSICGRCGKRVGSILEGKFCQACGSAVHFDCMPTDPLPGMPGQCLTCGTDPSSAAAIAEAAQDRTPQPAPPAESYGPMEAIGRTVGLYRAVRFWLAAVFCVGLGVALLLIPDLRDDPGHFTLRDAAPGAAALLVGLLLCLVGFLAFRRK